ncbi:hypothetical protein BJ741DRAFT_696340 [Chytriomyces cf. hyalinus JEL632]|nr:hypothetical protein BJ741DRAFT_696340 [Chytriomyces cf. hyalinus JEL632]
MLTGQQGASSEASPDMMDLKNRRLAIASEPEKGKTINSGFMKGLTGNDDIVARQLYGEIVKFKPTHATVFLTNDIPPMDQSDAAVKARLVIVPFPTLFTSVVTMPHHRPIDLTLKRRVKSWGPQLMLRLIEWNEWYCEEGLTRPRGLENSTESYAREHNLGFRWYESTTEYDEKEGLHFSEMHKRYLPWHLEETGKSYTFGSGKLGREICDAAGVVKSEFRRPGIKNSSWGIRNRRFI